MNPKKPVSASAGKKIVDIAHPAEAKPTIGSKPMSAGHSSNTKDTTIVTKKKMLVGDGGAADSKAPQSDNAPTDDTAPISRTPKKKIVPLSQSLADPSNKKSVSDSDDRVVIEDAVVEDQVDEDASASGDDSTDPESGDKPLDPVALQMERDEKLSSMIRSKKYRVPIKESSGLSLRAVVLAIAGLIVAAVVGLFVLIDTNTVDLGIDLPFRIFDSEEVEPEGDASVVPEADITAEEVVDIDPADEIEEDIEAAPIVPAEFSLEVPEEWNLDVSYELIALGASTYTYTLPSGTELKFAPYGGGGGDCTPEPEDVPHVAGNACQTVEVLSRTQVSVEQQTLEKLGEGNVLYIERHRFTGQDGISSFSLCLTRDTEEPLLAIEEPFMGFVRDECAGFGQFNTTISEVDNTSVEYFENVDIQAIEAVLSTFELV